MKRYNPFKQTSKSDGEGQSQLSSAQSEKQKVRESKRSMTVAGIDAAGLAERLRDKDDSQLLSARSERQTCNKLLALANDEPEFSKRPVRPLKREDFRLSMPLTGIETLIKGSELETPKSSKNLVPEPAQKARIREMASVRTG